MSRTLLGGRGVLVLALVVSSAAPMGAEVIIAASGEVRQYCATTDNSEHPSEIEMVQILRYADLDELDQAELSLTYGTASLDASRDGRIAATVTLLEDNGEEEVLGAIQCLPDPDTGEGQGGLSVERTLGLDDTLLWSLRLKRFDTMLENRCFLAVAMVARLEEE